MDQYNAYISLVNEFTKALGYCNRLEIPEPLVRSLAEFCDVYSEDMMTAYYAASVLRKFYRKRTRERSTKLFGSFNSHLRRKKLLLEIFFRRQSRELPLARAGDFDIPTIWLAIDDLDDGYGIANYIGSYSDFFTDEIAALAYQRAEAMPDAYKTRALAGIYPRMDEAKKARVFSYIVAQFSDGSPEAAYRLKSLFPYLDRPSKDAVISLHLDTPNLPETYTAYLVIRNANYFEEEDAKRLAAKAREFESEYLKNRCLLKLAPHLPAAEIEERCRRFMESFETQEASTELIHNLYHFSAVVKTLEKKDVIHLALKKIASFDDSGNEYYDQNKYNQMMFIAPHLSEEHKEQAFIIAGTVKGGYKRTLLARLKSHFSNGKSFCAVRYSPIFY